MQDRFWMFLQQLVDKQPFVIDRSAGSHHPRFPNLVYPLDYGYLKGTFAMDNGGIDVWRGSLCPSLLNGVFCSVDIHKFDAEIKIVLGCSPEEVEIIHAFQNDQCMAAIWIPNPTL